jgi:hypothetical protein
MGVLMDATDMARVLRSVRRLEECRYLNIAGVMQVIEVVIDDLGEALVTSGNGNTQQGDTGQ